MKKYIKEQVCPEKLCIETQQLIIESLNLSLVLTHIILARGKWVNGYFFKFNMANKRGIFGA